jgi:hypothetical protein
MARSKTVAFNEAALYIPLQKPFLDVTWVFLYTFDNHLEMRRG